MLSAACCIFGAVVGAGFASGKEVWQFFARYGVFSWGWIALSTATMVLWIRQILDLPDGRMLLPAGRFSAAGRWSLILLLLSAAGAMTAAAGELAALTLPVHFARSIGAGCTLIFCLWACTRPLRLLARLGCVLLPLIRCGGGGPLRL